jgi:hypothetical protein
VPPVGRKAAEASRKRRRSRPRRRSRLRRILPPDLGPIADDLPRSNTSDNLSPIIGPIEPPSWWSRERLREQYEEQERRKKQLNEHEQLRKAGERLENSLRAPQPVTVVSSTELTDEQIETLMGDVSDLADVPRKLRRYVVKKYRDHWRHVSPTAARKDAEDDEEYRKEFTVLYHESSWRRAFGLKEK